MKSITIEELLELKPHCGEHHIRKIMGEKMNWTALDMLALEDISVDDRLRAVLCEELIDAPMLHEFACCCAEHVLLRAHNPNPRSIAAIEAKRGWLRGEVSDDQLDEAWDAAWNAIGFGYMLNSKWDFEEEAIARTAIFATARVGVLNAELTAAWTAAWAAAWGVGQAVEQAAERQWQIELLISMLQGGET